MEFSSRILSLMQYVVTTLMVLTVGVLLWHHYGMEQVLELSAHSKYDVVVLDDSTTHGASVGTLERSPDALTMHCHLEKRFEYPYCKLRFELGALAKGTDLTQFDSMSFDLSYSGPGPHLVRIMIRNFEPAISSVADDDSLKINEVAFPVPASGVVVLPMKVFRTALWWTEERNVPLADSDVRVDKVRTVDISTGTKVEGEHSVEVRSVKFHGKWISQNQLLMILVGVWITCGVIWPALGALHFRAQLKRSNTRLALLSGINQALELETRELAGQAYHDPLTGALNRQGLRDSLMKSWNASGVLAEAMAVVFIDLDHFKMVNDKHGHEVGDKVLHCFAALMRREIRSTDKLVRWGGEEFLIICHGTTAVQAAALGDKLRRAMAAEAWPLDLHITSSFGVTSLNNGEEIVEAIKRADGALYQAKANGRDCVEVA